MVATRRSGSETEAVRPSPKRQREAPPHEGAVKQRKLGTQDVRETAKPQAKASKTAAAPTKATKGGSSTLPKADTTAEEKQLDQKEEVLEHGRIYFLYKPKVEETDPRSLDDVAKLHLVLTPHTTASTDKAGPSRLIIMGRKILPESAKQPLWGFVKTVSADGAAIHPHLQKSTYSTKTAGKRTVHEDRIFGEGPYAIVSNGKQTSLMYVLAEPTEEDEVQQAFHLAKEGAFLITVKNPDAGNPPQAGLQTKAAFPAQLKEVFHGRRWAPILPVQFLDHENAEILLVGHHDAGEKPGVGLLEEIAAAEQEDVRHLAAAEQQVSDKIYEDLHLKKGNVDTAPIQGHWD